jgi:hypothetical protein
LERFGQGVNIRFLPSIIWSWHWNFQLSAYGEWDV